MGLLGFRGEGCTSNGCLDIPLSDEVVWVDFGVGFFLVGCEEGGGFWWVGKGDVRLFLGTFFQTPR